VHLFLPIFNINITYGINAPFIYVYQIEPVEIQAAYDPLEREILENLKNFGINKNDIKTDDKLSLGIKTLIEKRTQIKSKVTLNVSEQLELVELKKLIKKKIQEDLKSYNEQVAREIIESTWSSKKTKKALSLGQNLLPRIKNKEGEEISDRDKIVEIATNFFENLYKVTT